ncbi:MAG: cytochrome c [Silicimonas sp.]|jgi:mono/diheme cytochrome c family protein|nr:cytochrome c [Silicimonas sp.]
MLRTLIVLLGLGLVVLITGLWVTRAVSIPSERFAGIEGDAVRGERVFTASGCASCHAAPDSDDKTLLGGGKTFKTAFGTFAAPNISPDPEAGIGGWTLAEFASAVMEGTSPEGSHYYPVFPYSSYVRMSDADVADLWAHMQTLPGSDRANTPHEVGFPFNVRESLGGWKLLFLKREWVTEAMTPEVERGRYLVEALGHCGECHTPRNALGGLDRAEWLAGAPNPTGSGRIPSLGPDALDWIASDIAYYLETGFTPDFDTAGGEMVSVIENTSKLPPEDRAAIAAYLKALGE